MDTSRIYSLIGLCRKSGQLSVGQAAVENAIKKGRAELVVIASDAALNTRQRFQNFSERFDIPVVVTGNKQTLGSALGREECAVIAVEDEGFAQAIKSFLEIGPKGI